MPRPRRQSCDRRDGFRGSPCVQDCPSLFDCRHEIAVELLEVIALDHLSRRGLPERNRAVITEFDEHPCSGFDGVEHQWVKTEVAQGTQQGQCRGGNEIVRRIPVLLDDGVRVIAGISSVERDLRIVM